MKSRLVMVCLIAMVLPEISNAEFDEKVVLKAERLALRSKSNIISSVTFGHAQRLFKSDDERVTRSIVKTEGRLGMRLWKGKGELYGFFGAYKDSNSLMVSQVRPYIALDMYPLSGKWGQVVSYHRIDLPFSGSDETNEGTRPSRFDLYIRPSAYFDFAFGFAVDEA